MARPPRNLQATPTGPAPAWVTVLGAMFGAITLFGLFVLAFFASKDPKFICNAFSLLAAVFSLGAALSAGFIGGAAAVTGNFGSTAQKNALLFSAGGGVAVLVLAFLGFNYFKGNDCNLQSAIDTQKNQITSLKTENADLSEKIKAFKSGKIAIVVTSSHPAMLKQVLIQYNSKTAHGPKNAQRLNNVFKIDQNDLTQEDPGIFISYDPSMLPAEKEGQPPPPISIQRLDPTIDPLGDRDPLRLQLFLDFPQTR